MSAMVEEALDLMQKAEDYKVQFVIEYLKQEEQNVETKKEALNRLASIRKDHTLISNDYKEEYRKYFDERYKV